MHFNETIGLFEILSPFRVLSRSAFVLAANELKSRSYDTWGRRTRFRGHDGVIEVPFFIEVSALHAVAPEAKRAESRHLESIDAALEQMHAVGRKAYKRGGMTTYCLTARDLERTAAGSS